MFEYYYHEILRNTIVSFGTLFNNLQIKHKDESGDDYNVIKVPLAYGPTQKFLARLEQSPDLNKPVQMSLPRMSFEFTSLTYDTSRKVSTTQTFTTSLASDKKAIRKVFMPVPYNMSFELAIYTKINDDMLQIIEQILPYFQPHYNLSVNLVSAVGEKRDIPVIFEGITMTDNYEGNFDTRRALIYTLRFTAKTYLYGPVADVSKDIIKKVTVGYTAGDQSATQSRDLSYSVEPRATKNYTGDATTTLAENLTKTEVSIEVASATDIAENTYIYIGQEEMYVTKKVGNVLTVKRGQDNTVAAEHVLGEGVFKIDAADNALIEAGDDFGFTGL